MSQEIKALKEEIKHAKAAIKRISGNANKAGINPNPMIDIYKRGIEENEVAIRGLKIRERVQKAGVDYDEWWTWAQSLYSYTNDMASIERPWTVLSKARNWDRSEQDNGIWYLEDEISCKEKIEQLVGYKIRDRKRGHGSMEKDLGVVSES